MNNLSEEEILNIMNKLGNIYDELKKDDEEGHTSAYEMQFEDFEATQGLLNLYNKEKETIRKVKNACKIDIAFKKILERDNEKISNYKAGRFDNSQGILNILEGE